MQLAVRRALTNELFRLKQPRAASAVKETQSNRLSLCEGRASEWGKRRTRRAAGRVSLSKLAAESSIVEQISTRFAALVLFC